MNCPHCSIHNLRGQVGLKAHIRHSHKELLQGKTAEEAICKAALKLLGITAGMAENTGS